MAAGVAGGGADAGHEHLAPAAGASARDGQAGAVGRERAGAASWSCSWPPSHSQVPSPVLADAVPVAARAILAGLETAARRAGA